MPLPPAQSTLDRNAPALALSGGGFRATLYHCGTLKRLNEMGYLSKLARISSVSGGSIASGMLAARWSRLVLENGVFVNLDAVVIEPLRAFCRRDIDQTAVGWGSILPGKSIGDSLADAYDQHLFAGATLQDLLDSPQFVFNATNLQTGRLVRMQKSRLAEYTLGQIPNPDVPLAVVVAASSAFPPVLSPVSLKVNPSLWQDLPGTRHFGDQQYCRTLALTDGGAYDNLGLETVDDFNPVIVSDAGAPFGAEEAAHSLWPKQAMRVLDIATDQSRALRKRLLFANAKATSRKIAFAGIDGDPGKYDAVQVLRASAETIVWLAGLRTRLNEFTDIEQGKLINWGWLMTDVAMRSNVTVEQPAPQQWPVPDYPLD